MNTVIHLLVTALGIIGIMLLVCLMGLVVGCVQDLEHVIARSNARVVGPGDRFDWRNWAVLAFLVLFLASPIIAIVAVFYLV